MSKNLLIIVLSGVITGMTLSVPSLFLSDIVFGGLVVGFFAGVIGFFILRRKEA